MGERTVGVAVVLFTDLVGSTALRSAVGEEVADRFAQAHERLLRKIVAAHDGTVIQGTGDGVMAVFPSASSALSSAVHLQQAVASTGLEVGPQAIRVGLGAGDVTWVDGDCFGRPVIEAARLEARAERGQILCTRMVRMLAAGRGDHDFVELGDFDLKGLPEPVPVCAVAWETADPSGVDIASDPVIDALRAPGFVGRADELQFLADRWKQIETNRFEIVLIGGEAGVGKTSLAAEFAARVALEDGVVWIGRSARDQPPAYQVWEDAFAATAPPGLFRVGHGRPSDGEDSDRFRFYAELEALLEQATRDRPGLLVLDDLSWADRPSLLLLEHLGRHTRVARCLVIGTYRDAPLDKREPFSQLVSRIERTGRLHIRLHGLTETDIGEYLAQHHDTDRRAIHSAASFVYRQTDGNAFLVAAAVPELLEQGIETDPAEWMLVTRSVQDIVEERLALAGGDARRALHYAAAIGRSFHAELIATAAAVDLIELAEDLDVAVASGLIRPARAATTGAYEFVHDLVREVILIDAGTTAGLHRALANAIQTSVDWTSRAPELVRHLMLSGSTSARRDAIECARTAAERAPGAQAVTLLEQAREAAVPEPGGLPVVDEYGKIEIDLELGIVRKQAGFPGGGRLITDSALVAERLGFDDLLIRAALAGGRGIFARSGTVDHEREHVLRAAIDRTPAADVLTHARLLGQLGAELTWKDSSEAVEHTRTAIALARREHDTRTLIRALLADFSARWRPSEATTRWELIAELETLLAQESGERRWSFAMHSFAFPTALEIGDRASAHRHLATMQEMEPDLASPETSAYCRLWESVWATLGGDIDSGESLAMSFAALFRRIGKTEEADAWTLGLLYPIHWHRGTLDELEPLFSYGADQESGLAVLPAALAAIRAQLGDREGALAALGRVPRDHLSTGTAMVDHLVALSVLADAEARLRDPGRAQWLVEQLRPLADQYVLNGTTYFGSVKRPLAIAHSVAGDDGEADRLFAAAIDENGAQGAPALVARSQVDWARELLARSGDQRGSGVALADEARHAAEDRWVGIDADAAELVA